MDKKRLARMEMLRKLAKSKDAESPGLAEGLKSKKMQKVEVIAKDKKGLEEGLSKAQQILKSKLGAQLEDSADEESDEDCEECEGEGCPACEEMEEA